MSAALFSLEYTIPRTQLKDIELSSEHDWETFLGEAGKKPSAQGKLTIKEKLVSLFSRPLPSDTLIPYPTLLQTSSAAAAAKAQQAEESEDEEDADKKKKSKKVSIIAGVALRFLTVHKACPN